MEIFNNRGQALVELAIVIPILILLLMWAKDYQMILEAKYRINEAARFGVWEKAIIKGKTTGRITKEILEKFNRSYPLSITLEDKSSFDMKYIGSFIKGIFSRFGLNTNGKISNSISIQIGKELFNPILSDIVLNERYVLITDPWNSLNKNQVRSVVERQHIGGIIKRNPIGKIFGLTGFEPVRINVDAIP